MAFVRPLLERSDHRTKTSARFASETRHVSHQVTVGIPIERREIVRDAHSGRRNWSCRVRMTRAKFSIQFKNINSYASAISLLARPLIVAMIFLGFPDPRKENVYDLRKRATPDLFECLERFLLPHVASHSSVQRLPQDALFFSKSTTRALLADSEYLLYQAVY
ncbi:hypothetical protein VTO42DRAFT_1362 [Malbranchea cinnamomea]